MIPLVLSQGLILEEELLLDELLLKEETTLLLAEETKLLLNEDAKLLLDEEARLLLNEDAKLLLDELLSVVGDGVLGLLLPPPPPPQAVNRVNILASSIMCFNINLPLSIKVVLLISAPLFFDLIDKLLRKRRRILTKARIDCSRKLSCHQIKHNWRDSHSCAALTCISHLTHIYSDQSSSP